MNLPKHQLSRSTTSPIIPGRRRGNQNQNHQETRNRHINIAIQTIKKISVTHKTKTKTFVKDIVKALCFVNKNENISLNQEELHFYLGGINAGHFHPTIIKALVEKIEEYNQVKICCEKNVQLRIKKRQKTIKEFAKKINPTDKTLELFKNIITSTFTKLENGSIDGYNHSLSNALNIWIKQYFFQGDQANSPQVLNEINQFPKLQNSVRYLITNFKEGLDTLIGNNIEIEFLAKYIISNTMDDISNVKKMIQLLGLINQSGKEPNIAIHSLIYFLSLAIGQEVPKIGNTPQPQCNTQPLQRYQIEPVSPAEKGGQKNETNEVQRIEVTQHQPEPPYNPEWMKNQPNQTNQNIQPFNPQWVAKQNTQNQLREQLLEQVVDPVSLDTMTTPVNFPCGHTVDLTTAKNLVNEQGSDTCCPMDRKQLFESKTDFQHYTENQDDHFPINFTLKGVIEILNTLN